MSAEPKHGFRLKVWMFVIVVLCLPCATGNAETAERPRVGLVLAGGGAKGAAHIGVLKVLERLRIPIDCIAGTSMGALVGGTYSAGLSATEIESVVLSNDWTDTFTNREMRDETPMRRKLSGITYSNQLELGIRGGKVTAPGGLFSTQGVEELIRNLVAEARGIRTFDKLPIPFRAVATDVITGQMMVFDRGELEVAMRASMAIPGAFSPVVVGEKVLIDGGLVRNLPVDIARAACADIVIAVRLQIPEVKAADLDTAFSVIGQTIDMVITSNETAQWQTLGDADIRISVPMGDIGTGDFDRLDEAIPLGEASAQTQAEALEKYSVSIAEYAQWRAAVERRSHAPRSTLAAVEIAGLERVNPHFARSRIQSTRATEFDSHRAQADADRLFALGEFERVDYELVGSADNTTLQFLATEKPWGPDYLSFDLGLYAGSRGDVEYVIQADHRRSWINSLGGEWHNIGQLGRSSLLSTTVYQPLNVNQQIFTEANLIVRRDIEDFFNRGERVAIYNEEKAIAQLDFGLSPTRRLESRIGYRFSHVDLARDTGSSLLPEGSYKDAGLQLRVVYDDLDSSVVPTSGWSGILEYYGASTRLGGERDYERLEMLLIRPFTAGNNTVDFRIGGGTSLGSDLPGNDSFAIGGFRSLPGIRRSELRGQEYWLTSFTYGRRLSSRTSIFGTALYYGLVVSAGQVTDRVDLLYLADEDELLTSIALVLSGRSPIGPLDVGLGFSNQGDVELSISIGRPLAEGSLFGRAY